MTIELNTLSPKKWVASYSGITPTIDSSNGVRVGDFAIDTSTTPNRVWKCEKSTIGSPVWVPMEDLTKTMSATGLINGGILSINGGDNTKFDLAAGAGYIVDNSTNPEAPVVTKVVWPTRTGLTTPYRTTNSRTEILINSAANVVTQTTVSQADMRDYIYIGKVIHNNLSTINAVNTLPHVAYNVALKSCDISKALGSINISGNAYSANGANLNINKTSGDIFRVGSNYVISKKLPNIFTSAAATPVTFRYRYQNGSGGFTTTGTTTAIDPNKYDDGSGVLQSVPTNKYTIQRVYLYAGTDNTYITYGQYTYNSLTEAKAAIPYEEPIIDPVTSDEGVLRCYLVVKEGTTALNNTTYNYFKTAGKLGEPMGGGAAGGDVVGPATSTDRAFAKFDGTTGKLLADGSNATLDDSGNATFNGKVIGRSNVVSIANTYTINSNDCVILANSASTAFTINLPAVSTNTGLHVYIKKVDSSANVISVDGNSAEKIDNELIQYVNVYGDCMEIICNGTGWNII